MANDPTTTGLPGDDNVKESIEFEPVLRTDIIESQLDSLRSRIENAFGMANFDPVAGLQTSLNGPINSIQNGGERLLQSSQNVINSFMAAPETVSREFGMTSSGIGNTAHNIDQMSANVGSFGSLFGAGYDWRSPVQRSDYVAESNKRAGRAVGDFVADNIGTGIGLAVGWGNPIIGLGVGKAFDITIGAGIERERAIRGLAHNFRDIANESRTGISKDTSKDLARMIYDKAESFEGYATDLTVKELKENIGTFANAGGFRNVRSPQEFKETVEAVINNTRDISKTLGMFQDEVLNLMAELKNKGIATVSESKELLLGLQGQATASGVNTNDLIQQGFAASEMFKGTRFGQKNAFNYGIDVYSQMERMYRNNDDIYGGAIIRQGGPAGAARNMMGILARFGQQDAMSQYYYEQSTGQNYTGGVEQQLYGGPEFFAQNGINGLLSAKGRENEIAGNTPAQRQAQNLVSGTIGYLDMLGIGRNQNGTLNPDALAGFMIGRNGIRTRDQAELSIGYALQNNNLQQLDEQQSGEALNSLRTSHPSFFGAVSAGAKSFWDWFKQPTLDIGRYITAGTNILSHGVTDMLDAASGNIRFRSSDISDSEINLIKSGDYEKYMSDIYNDENVIKANKAVKEAGDKLGGFNPNVLNRHSSDISDKTRRYMAEYVYKSGTDWQEKLKTIADESGGDINKLQKGLRKYLEANGSSPTQNQVDDVLANEIYFLRPEVLKSPEVKDFEDKIKNRNEIMSQATDKHYEETKKQLIKNITNTKSAYINLFKKYNMSDEAAEYNYNMYLEGVNKDLSQRGIEEYMNDKENQWDLTHLDLNSAINGPSGNEPLPKNKLHEIINHFNMTEGTLGTNHYSGVLIKRIKDYLIRRKISPDIKKGSKTYEALVGNMSTLIPAIINKLPSGDVNIDESAIGEAMSKLSEGLTYDNSNKYINAFNSDKIASELQIKTGLTNKVTEGWKNAGLDISKFDIVKQQQMQHYSNFSKVFIGNDNKKALRVDTNPDD